MTSFIGIDLAWTYKNPTGICVFDEQLKCLYLEAKLFSDQEIQQLVSTYKEVYVSVDAPLVVRNETGGRACDSLLMKTRIHGRQLKLYATSRSYMNRTFGGVRGELLGKLLGSDQVYETYPTGIFLCLMPHLFDNRYKLSSRQDLRILKTNMAAVIAALHAMGYDFTIPVSTIETKKAYKYYEDLLDAVLCAVNSHQVFLNKHRSYQCDDNGNIVLPDHNLVKD